MSPDEEGREGEPQEPGDSTGAENDQECAPDDDPDADGVPYGLDVLEAALDRQVNCPHGFDPRYCPFGCT